MTELWIDQAKQKYADVPVMTLDELRALPEAGEQTAGVYFLWNGQDLLYVGRSHSIRDRLMRQAHVNKFEYWRHARAQPIPFDRHTCIVVDEENRDRREAKMQDIERAYIAHYEPSFNSWDQNGGT